MVSPLSLHFVTLIKADMEDVLLLPHEEYQGENLEGNVYASGRLDLDASDRASVILAKQIASNGLADGIRHDLTAHQVSTKDGKFNLNTFVAKDLDSIAFKFSQNRHVTLYRHCLLYVCEEMDVNDESLDIDSDSIRAFAWPLFFFVRPYYFHYLQSSLPEKNTHATMKYIQHMMSDSEPNCFSLPANPLVLNSFVVR